jgi:choline dehydrogenase-like flavoprotein
MSPWIVLAAGAIENARLLQLSDPAGVGLGDGRQHTGHFLQTHPVINTARIHPVDHRVFSDRYVLLGRGRHRVFPKVRLAPAGQREHKLLDATAVFLHEYDDPAYLASRRLVAAARQRRLPDHVMREVLLSLGQAGPHLRDLYRRYARGLASRSRPRSIFLQLWLEQQPDPDSRLDLADTRDSLGLRQARVRWKLGEPERRTSRQMTRWIADDLARLGLGRTEELLAMSDDGAWTEAVRDAAHPSGTTRMSTDATTGVVDADLQVHGIKGLYVVGSSVFPIAGYANPTLTIVALALRLSDQLATKIKR